MRDSIMLYRSQCDALRHLPADQFKAALTAIWDYGMDDIEPEGDPIIIAMVGMMKPLIDKNNKNYENGKRGGRKANRSETEDNRIEPNGNRIKPSDNRVVTECNPKEKGERRNIKEDISKDISKKSGFQPPTLTEVEKYITEQGYNIDAQRFVDFYASKGWMIGKNQMKDWKAAVRSWSRSQRPETTAKANGFTIMNGRDFDWDDFGRVADGI